LAGVHGHSRRKIRRGHDRYAIAFDDDVCLADCAVTSRRACEIDNDRAAFHSIDSFLGDEQWRSSSRHLCCCDDDIGSLCMFCNQRASTIHRFFRKFDCVTACIFSFDSAEIDFEKRCAQGFHLLTCSGAHVVTFDDCAETSCGRDRL
jgi:hypothetical protein